MWAFWAVWPNLNPHARYSPQACVSQHTHTYCTCTCTHASSATWQDCLLQQFAVFTNPVNSDLKSIQFHFITTVNQTFPCLFSTFCLRLWICKWRSRLWLSSGWPGQVLCPSAFNSYLDDREIPVVSAIKSLLCFDLKAFSESSGHSLRVIAHWGDWELNPFKGFFFYLRLHHQ